MEGDDAMKERLLRKEIRKQAREIEAEEEEPVTSPTPQSVSSTRPEQSQQAESSSRSSPTPKSVDRGADITSRTRKETPADDPTEPETTQSKKRRLGGLVLACKRDDDQTSAYQQFMVNQQVCTMDAMIDSLQNK